MPSSDPFAGHPRVRHTETCICHTCRGRRRREAREALREPRVLVYSDQAAEHIAALLSAGWTRSEIARAAGVSAPLITKAQKPGNFLNERSAGAPTTHLRPRRRPTARVVDRWQGNPLRSLARRRARVRSVRRVRA